MKIRTDYVTNSSSSSFIIARKKSYTEKDLKLHLMKDEVGLKKLIKNLQDFEDMDDSYSFDDCVNAMVDRLYPYNGLECGDYIVASLGSGNEDGFPYCIPYEYSIECDGENFKIREEY